MLSTSRGAGARDLPEYGEDAVAAWVMSCGDDEFLKVCAVAEQRADRDFTRRPELTMPTRPMRSGSTSARVVR